MLKRNTIHWLLLAHLVWLYCSPVFAAPVNIPPPGTQDRCPVCGMFVAPYPSWLATVQLDDQTMLYFDGPQDMFNYLEDRETYHPGQTPPAINAVYVTDYYTRQTFPAGDVFFISGSDVLGPMGHERVPVAGDSSLKTFLQDHGGDKVEIYREDQLKEIPAP